ncbi:ribokinase [Aliishimia ponticola]|uniref:Ribokinase n=1 Tax=Aliishimia ponticola TaxID=2499833 RepID=A0A4S4NET5_9RHOB|nr:ribokinase [Aliishimia ponticola]THH38019.1 ribokinase [Aliishimia ponticola]
MTGHIAILGVFVADCAFRADRPPHMGETLLGKSFQLGPGGKGSNQAVAAARAGCDTRFISRLGRDTFADLALATWRDAGVTPAITQGETATGAAYIFINDTTGQNAIIIVPGAAAEITPEDVERQRDIITSASVFVTQLEQPLDAALCGLRMARGAGVTTILNPAPAADLPAEFLPLCDYVTPNEPEATALTGIEVTDLASAEAAGNALLDKGAGAALLTLGEMGALLVRPEGSIHIAARPAGPVIDTTGAGDAFNGGFAAALAQGMDPIAAMNFAAATAGLSITRHGTAASMPSRAEIDAALAAT